MSSEFPLLLKRELDMVGENSNKATQRINGFSQKYLPIVAKSSTKFENIYNDLIIEPVNSTNQQQQPMEEDVEHDGITDRTEDDQQPKEEKNEPELSIHAQFLLTEALDNFRKTISDMSQEHKHPIHHLISRCGKWIDTKFYPDLSKLLKNEKDLENNPENLAQANRLILEHLIGLGRTEVAETFLKESEMSLRLPEITNFDNLKEIMNSFKQRNYLPAIEWLKENAPERRDLLFQIQCQHIIRLLDTSNKLEALRYVKELQSFTLEECSQELAHLMYVVISYPKKEPYEYFFHEGRWFALEEELAHALTDYRSSLSTILSAGAKTVPSLMTMRAFMSSARPGSLPILSDELPCTVPIPEQVHSSFCCPILKVQSTENNPPMRLSCGHVISRDAMNKLAQPTRNNRLKCPYCPLETVLHEAKELYF